MLKQKQLKPQIIYAMDSDSAGRDALRKFVPKVRQAGFWTRAVLPPVGKDWNDLLLAKSAQAVTETISYEPPFRGSIVIAQNTRMVASEAILSRTIPLYTQCSSRHLIQK